MTASRILATIHPSAILRAPDRERRHREFQRLVKDLRVVAGSLSQHRAA